MELIDIDLYSGLINIDLIESCRALRGIDLINGLNRPCQDCDWLGRPIKLVVRLLFSLRKALFTVSTCITVD